MMRATLRATALDVTFVALSLQARVRLLRQQFHSTIRCSRTHFWNEWFGSVKSLSGRAPRIACSLIRRTFQSPVVTPDVSHMQWHGASRSALPPGAVRSQWRAHLCSPTGDTLFSHDFYHSHSLRFASLTSLHESGRFDAPFSYNEFVVALSKCHESAPGADCLPHSLFKVSFPWWRHLLLFFFNLVLRFAVVPSSWKSSLVVPVIISDGDPILSSDFSRILRIQAFEPLIYAVMSTLLPRKLLIPAGSKPLLSVSVRFRCHGVTLALTCQLPVWHFVPSPYWWLCLSTLGRLWQCATAHRQSRCRPSFCHFRCLPCCL